MKPGAISVGGVSRRFVVRAREAHTLKQMVVSRGRGGAQEVWALRDVSLEIEQGQAVGLVGRNGSGKSTLLRLVAGIIKPTLGTIASEGRIGSLLELGAGFHPDFTGRENVFLSGSIQGLSRVQIRERFEEMVAFAEIEHAIDRPVRTYSSGMAMRLGFSVAAFLDAEILLLDEVFAVGDESFQRKCFGVISQFKQRGGTIVFVSHDAAAVERLCERSVHLHRGHVAFDGSTHEALAEYRRALADEDELAVREGDPPEAGTLAARIVSACVLASDGLEREQFLAGEPIGLLIELESSDGALAPPRLYVELRDVAGLLIAEDEVDLGSLGWREGARRVRLDLPEPSLQFGRFRLRVGLLDGADGRLLHSVDDIVFLVYPDGRERGLVRLGGTWSTAVNGRG